MVDSLDLRSWRKATGTEISAWLKSKEGTTGESGRSLIVRKSIRPVDMYCYMKARFGEPNGIQNLLRKDDSDNWIHWDFNLVSCMHNIYICGTSRDIHFILDEELTDREWMQLISSIKNDFGLFAKEKSEVLKSLEKFVVFQNQFVAVSGLCASFHEKIVDLPRPTPISSLISHDFQENSDLLQSQLAEKSLLMNELYATCLQLKLLMPVMVESFINMLILILRVDKLRHDKERYREFIRSGIVNRISSLHTSCIGFNRQIDKSSNEYATFMRVMGDRNVALHGDVDPERDQLEVVFFDGKRPLFVTPGNHIEHFHEQLERIHKPSRLIDDYENIHLFIIEIINCISEPYREFVLTVISDAYPGYEVKDRRVTRILPDRIISFRTNDLRYDDEIVL